MSVDTAMRELVDAAIAAAVRVERDRLARILRDHGYARIARDVECCDDEGAGPGACPTCHGAGEDGGYDAARGMWTQPCAPCSGTGHRAPRVTA